MNLQSLHRRTSSSFVIWNVVGVYIKDLVKLQRNNKYKCSWHVMRLITSAVMVEHVVFSSETTAKYSCAFLYKDLSNTLIHYWDKHAISVSLNPLGARVFWIKCWILTSRFQKLVAWKGLQIEIYCKLENVGHERKFMWGVNILI